MTAASLQRVYAMRIGNVYPLYVAKVTKKGRTQAEVDEVIRWLTGYTQAQVDAHLRDGTTLEAFFADAPQMNPARARITGVICGVRIEEIQEATMREIRYLDKLVDELAKGRPMQKVLREG